MNYIIFFAYILSILFIYFYYKKINNNTIETFDIKFNIKDKYKSKYLPRKYDKSKYHSRSNKVNKTKNKLVVEKEPHEYILTDKELRENELLNYLQPKISVKN